MNIEGNSEFRYSSINLKLKKMHYLFVESMTHVEVEL